MTSSWLGRQAGCRCSKVGASKARLASIHSLRMGQMLFQQTPGTNLANGNETASLASPQSEYSNIHFFSFYHFKDRLYALRRYIYIYIYI